MLTFGTLMLGLGGTYAVSQTHYTTRHIYSETADPKAEIAAATDFPEKWKPQTGV